MKAQHSATTKIVLLIAAVSAVGCSGVGGGDAFDDLAREASSQPQTAPDTAADVANAGGIPDDFAFQALAGVFYEFRVEDENGAPVADTPVRIFSISSRPSDPLDDNSEVIQEAGFVLSSGITAADGAFRGQVNLPSDTLAVLVRVVGVGYADAIVPILNDRLSETFRPS